MNKDEVRAEVLEVREEPLEIREELLKEGFTEKQIEHLKRLRKAYVEEKQLQIVTEQRRLEFARWLITTGRLTESNV